MEEFGLADTAPKDWLEHILTLEWAQYPKTRAWILDRYKEYGGPGADTWHDLTAEAAQHEMEALWNLIPCAVGAFFGTARARNRLTDVSM